MSFVIRPLTDDEKPSYDRLRARALFARGTPEQRELAWATRQIDRVFGAFDGGTLIGAAASYGFTMSVPGGEVPAAGVAGVAVLPTHTRRGALRALMRAIFDAAGPRGEVVSCLWASEPGIYGRFGYGIATGGLHWTLPRAAGAFDPAVAVTPGSGDPVRMLDRPDPEVLAPIYARMAETVPGVIARTPAWWNRRLHDPDDKLEAVVTEGGYALYSVSGGWTERGPDNTLSVFELVAPEPAAYVRLVRHLLDVDLVNTVTAGHRPVDDPVQWMLAESRSLQRRVSEGMWVRLLDVGAALAARSYAAPLDITVGIVDPLVPDNDGGWRLTVDGDGRKAQVERAPASAEPDLVLGAAALGAAYLGGTRLTHLASAGRVEERTPGAVARADRAFGWTPAPWAVTWF